MDVISVGPLSVSSLVWQPRPSMWALTVVAKATFLLLPTAARLAPEQDPIVEHEEHWDDDEARSLRAPSDLSPLKPRADVVLVGMAFAPEGRPLRSFIARLLVGEIDKSIEIFGDRAFAQDGSLQDGARITRMSLRYERAGGGPDTWNPAGMRPDARDRHGRIAVPNLQPVGQTVSAPGDFVQPIGFGPVAARWPWRLQRLGRNTAWSPSELRRAPLPEDIEQAYFNVAPPDQQVDAIRDDERIVLENLHPQHPHFVTSLPGLRPKAVLSGREGGPRAIPMRADTLVIDTERAICAVTWRGQLPLRSAAEKASVIVALEEPGHELSPADIEQLAAGPRTVPIPARPAPRAGEDLAKTTTVVKDQVAAEEALPFVAPTPGVAISFAPTARRPKEDPAAAHAQMEMTTAIAREEVASPEVALPFASAPQPRPPAPSSPDALERKQPAYVMPEVPAAAPPLASPWTAGVPQGSSPVQGLGLEIAPTPGPAGFSVGPQIAPPAKTIGEAAVEAEGTPLPAAAPAASEFRDVLVLLWLDRKSMPRVVRKPAWQKILDEFEEEPIDPEADDPALSQDSALIQDRSQAYAILERGAAISFERVLDALETAARKRGQFVPPLDIVEGELALPFDEIETLRAMIATATPLAKGNEALVEALKTAEAFIVAPGHASAPAVAVGLTTQIREAFVQGKRVLPADHLDRLVERALLEQRHYQRRKVFGSPHLRGLLHAVGEMHPMVVYVPAAVAEELPMYPRFGARILAELHFAIDEQEKRPAALRAVAIGRMVRFERR